MAFKFMTAGAAAASMAPHQSASLNKPATSTEPKKAFGGFLKTGKAAQVANAAEEAKREMAKEQYGKLWRFWVAPGADRRITFLDGELNDDGMLDITMFYEHTLFMNGGYENFICTADVDTSQPCPICHAGDKNSYVGVMTVIDHTPHEVQQGPNKGNIIVNQRRLFVAKHTTRTRLHQLAVKRGGLAGCTFDVSRMTEKEPRVGGNFDFVEKFDSYEDIAEKFSLQIEDVQPAVYENELIYRTPEELLELGVGKAVKSSFGGGKPFNSAKLSEQL